ncbi:response regulator transcription factor [Rhodanobacter sp. L36]|uniref:response regulator transcription factor n=1 Tax=Rhodanobacter sp. L36 TaxID=1747221 RepID=UPI00131EC4C0|nr:response regulator transcription factor [Rhodanobacter sp. L36]
MQIIIADDHPVALMGLRALLTEQNEVFQVVGEAYNGCELLQILAKRTCDLLITDFSMPTGHDSIDGLSLLKRVRRSYPNLPIIVLTMIHNPTLISGMYRAGAQAVVEKAAFTREMLLAIHIVANGGIYQNNQIRTDEPPSRSTVPAETNRCRIATLSPTEAEIVRLYVGGFTVTQIAEKLRRSAKTVSRQKSDAMRKLNLATSLDLYDYAKTYGLVF